VIVIDLPFATPSLNELMDWKHNPKTRAWKYRRHKEDVAALLGMRLAPLRNRKGYKPETRKMRVVFTRFSAGELDDDNLRGGFKPLRDALVELGVLVDDTSRWLQAEYQQVKTKPGDRRTRIEIEAVGG
jgi:hypothetical protein